jgi:hypothetical protein
MPRRVVERDAPFYDPDIYEEAVGHLSGPTSYEPVAAVRYHELWRT